MEAGILLFILAASFAGGVASGLIGFGAGVVSTVLWLYVLDPVVAIPLLAVCALFAQLMTLRVVWRKLDMRRLKVLLSAAVVGVPLGGWLLTLVEPRMFRICVGFGLALYAAWRLTASLRPKQAVPWLGTPLATGVVGFGSGFLGGFAGTTAPIVVLWATLQRWGREEQRAVYQPLMIVGAFMMILSYAAYGLLTWQVGVLALYCVPVMLIGTFAGIAIYRRITDGQFETVLMAVILVSGLSLALRALWS